MIKVSFFSGVSEQGPKVIPLFGPADSVFEKVAAPTLLPDVVQYISSLRPRNDAQYSLVNAMGAGEFWGSNVNGDHFPEAALIHRPDEWTGNPLIDKIKAKDWPYGFPTFYYAHPFAHHRNKDATRAFGEVELAAWNPHMKRVELVTRVDKDKCEQFGGVGVWDKLKAGEYPDVSMGAKVPFDTCSICLDWKLYREAQATFDPSKQRHAGEAVLLFHRMRKEKTGKGIRGLSITRNDYCDHARHQMNHILSDGRKVFVYNDYPRFFDISYVFIGADKTAKVMMKIASGEKKFWFLPGVELADHLGYEDNDLEEKTANSEDDLLKLGFGKVGKVKENEITKDVVPSQFAAKAVPLLTRGEEDLPQPVLDRLGADAMKGLSTAGALGIVLRPREFQRVLLVQMGQRPLATDLEDRGVVFPRVKEQEALPLDVKDFSSVLMRLLLPFMQERSAFGPIIERRVVLAGGTPREIKKKASSLSSELLRKMGAAYNGYRHSVMELVASSQDLVASAATPSDRDLLKLAAAPLQEMFTPLSAAYLKTSFMDEFGIGLDCGGYQSLRGEGFPLEEHAAIRNAFGGHTS